jgi:hypothetical protein
MIFFSIEITWLGLIKDKNLGFFFLISINFFLGGVFATLIPKEDYFSKALYTFDIGQNDLTAGFFGNATIQQVNATVPDIINNFIENIKVI